MQAHLKNLAQKRNCPFRKVRCAAVAQCQSFQEAVRDSLTGPPERLIARNSGGSGPRTFVFHIEPLCHAVEVVGPRGQMEISDNTDRWEIKEEMVSED